MAPRTHQFILNELQPPTVGPAPLPEMAYRRRYRSRARTYRRYRRSSFGRARRSSNMQFAAMQQQRDAARFCLKYRRDLTLTVAQGAKTGSTALRMAEVLMQVPQYTYFSGLFDECRLAGVRIKLIPTWQVSSANTTRMTQVTAWDRNGTWKNAPEFPSFDEICTYGSSYKQAATAFSKNTVNSSLYATDLAERTGYWPTTLISQLATSEQPFERPFMPTFLIGVQLPAATAADETFNYEVEIAYDLVFRGTRYDNGVAN